MTRRITNKKAPGRQSQGLGKHTTNSPEHNGKSTATQAQERRIVAALRGGPKSTDQLRALGCYQAAARIFGLRAKGWNIVTDRFTGYSWDGFSHAQMARYTLIGGPDGGR
jgi:hypothetical protein